MSNSSVQFAEFFSAQVFRQSTVLGLKSPTKIKSFLKPIYWTALCKFSRGFVSSLEREWGKGIFSLAGGGGEGGNGGSIEDS